MSKQGTFIGYDAKNNPVAVAIYGEFGETRASARSFAASGGLTVREFDRGDPGLEAELDRWREHALTLA